MRLLNTSDLTFKEFRSKATTPKYAILSHRWFDDEVDYKEWRKGRRKTGASYDKIKRFCRIARDYGYAWAWADTCCIDKRSSAELTEAINSMYAWYKQASLCIVYLSDVNCTSTTAMDVVSGRLKESAWFDRGWTLQELLAPSIRVFFSSEWTVLGIITAEHVGKGAFRNYYPLASLVSRITGIPYGALMSSMMIRQASVSKRMCWAATRQTSREEDMAYCLMGIFDVNMPLLYGEGAEKAFMRLQLEIIKKSTDESIFAWRVPDAAMWYGLLASSPRAFRHAGRISTAESDGETGDNDSVMATAHEGQSFARLPYTMTNRGLEFRAKAWSSRRFPGTYQIPLTCKDSGRPDQVCMVVLTGKRDSASDRVREVFRQNTADLGMAEDRASPWYKAVSFDALEELSLLCFEIPQAGL
ncbi:hypothetical protein LTR86_004817 [Recurvomyces mirabilis]|nr:hypothetical protein LTR86_004817 [Recurvomyces mirabilis]